MNEVTYKNLRSFISTCHRADKHDLVLFRGQDCDKPLLPKVVRSDPSVNSTEREEMMLEELRRVGGSFLSQSDLDNWDLLARAQHFQLATRLLDWTANPLVALWFACRNLEQEGSSYVYRFDPDKEDVLVKARDKTPFSTGRTLVYRPNLKNPRILAQSGWFTLHKYSEDSRRFVPLEENRALKTKIFRWEISHKEKPQILDQLDQLGISYLSLFPDLEGVCRHLNWIYDIKEPNKTPEPTPPSGVAQH
jgi:hypothetical protein